MPLALRLNDLLGRILSHLEPTSAQDLLEIGAASEHVPRNADLRSRIDVLWLVVDEEAALDVCARHGNRSFEGPKIGLGKTLLKGERQCVEGLKFG